MGKLKTANYWPYMKWNIIGLFALNLKIIIFQYDETAFLSLLNAIIEFLNFT